MRPRKLRLRPTSFTGVHQKIIHDVCVAYYLYLSTERHTVTSTKALQNAKEIQKAAEERYRGGIGTVLESTQARQVTAQAHLVMIQSEGARRDAYASLLDAMGFPLSKESKLLLWSDVPLLTRAQRLSRSSPTHSLAVPTFSPPMRQNRQVRPRSKRQRPLTVRRSSSRVQGLT